MGRIRRSRPVRRNRGGGGFGSETLEARILLTHFDADDQVSEALDLGPASGSPSASRLNINPVDDVDMFSFTVVADQDVRFRVISEEFLDGPFSARLRLFGTSIHGTVEEINRGVHDPFDFSIRFSDSGTYWVGVSEVANDFYNPVTGTADFFAPSSTTGIYSLFLTSSLPPEPMSDLRAASVSGPSSAIRGESVSVSTRIENNGDSSSGEFSVRYVLSEDSTIDSNDRILHATGRSSLSAGASTTFSLSIQIPSDVVPGTYRLGVIVDPFDFIDESNESNNAVAASGTISILSSDEPDLTLGSGAAISPKSVMPGQSIDVTVPVKNVGGDASVGGQLNYYFHEGSSSYLAADLVGTDQFSALNAGQTEVETFSFTVPQNATAGSYFFSFWIDGTELLTESNETNNQFRFTQPITITLPSDGSVQSTQKIAHLTNGGPALETSAFFGSAVASIGDLDGDGIADLAVGAKGFGDGENSSGSVHILFMNSDGTVKSSRKITSGTNGGPVLADDDKFGTSVTAIGDLDGDGVIDLAVGANGDDTGGFSRGAVHILFMKTDGTVKSSRKIASSTNGGPALQDIDFFGVSVAGIGDLNGDGVADLAVGAVADSTRGLYRGAVYVLFMNASGTVKTSTKISSGLNGGPALSNEDFFGTVSAIGDLDGDGVSDLAVGAEDSGGSNDGAVHILFMNANGTVKSTRKIASGVNGGPPLADADSWRNPAGLGDLDGDGVPDLLVGAPGDDTGGSGRGAVYVAFMNENGTVKSTRKIASGINGDLTLSNGDSFGNSVAAVGDLNGDGVTDLAVGAIGDDTDGFSRGAVHILFLEPITVDPSERLDLNDDGVVNTADLSAMRGQLLSKIADGSHVIPDRFDVNMDGVINTADLSAVRGHLLTLLEQGQSARPASPQVNSQADVPTFDEPELWPSFQMPQQLPPEPLLSIDSRSSVDTQSSVTETDAPDGDELDMSGSGLSASIIDGALALAVDELMASGASRAV